MSNVRTARRVRRIATEAASATLAVILLVWSLAPVYNMLLIALDPDGGDVEFTGDIWPPEPSLHSFHAVLTKDHPILADFWQQFGNSLYIGILVTILSVLIGSMASFATGRMRLRGGWMLTNAAFLTFIIPSSFLAIPFFEIMHGYGLYDNLWAIIAVDTAFATPYAILILRQYGNLVPAELDEAARVDGASPIQVYWRIYVPLMAPALAAVAIYALMLAWNEYVYQYLLLVSTHNWTVAVALAQFFNIDEAPWNIMMAIGIVYTLPPIAIFCVLRRCAISGLTMGGDRRSASR